MSDSQESPAEASTEKADVIAVETKVAEQDIPAPAEPAAPVAVDAAPAATGKPRGRKPRAAAPASRIVGESLVPALGAEPLVAAPAKTAVRRGRPPRAVAKPAKAIKRAGSKPVPAVAGKAAPVKLRTPAVQKIKTATKTVKAKMPVVSTEPSFITQLKEIPMDMTSSLKDAVSGAQDKAKEAFTKTSALAGEYGEFAKGNVEAIVESGKILAAGLQDMGSKFAADGKTAFETMTADVKELSAAKSPTDFLKLQTDLLRRNFDTAFAYGSKTSEAMLKLTNDVFAPISGRVNLAIEKVRKVA